MMKQHTERSGTFTDVLHRLLYCPFLLLQWTQQSVFTLILFKMIETENLQSVYHSHRFQTSIKTRPFLPAAGRQEEHRFTLARFFKVTSDTIYCKIAYFYIEIQGM